MDDMMMGAMLFVSANRMRQDTTRNRAFFCAAWGVNVGMLYGSLFGKVFAQSNTNAGTFDPGLLTALVGITFVTSIFGMLYSIILPTEEARE